MLAGCAPVPAENISSCTGTVTAADEQHIAVRISGTEGNEYTLVGNTRDIIIIRDSCTISSSELSEDEKVAVACCGGEISSIAVITE
jgi:hypothetical protein